MTESVTSVMQKHRADLLNVTYEEASITEVQIGERGITVKSKNLNVYLPMTLSSSTIQSLAGLSEEIIIKSHSKQNIFLQFNKFLKRATDLIRFKKVLEIPFDKTTLFEQKEQQKIHAMALSDQPVLKLHKLVDKPLEKLKKPSKIADFMPF